MRTRAQPRGGAAETWDAAGACLPVPIGAVRWSPRRSAASSKRLNRRLGTLNPSVASAAALTCFAAAFTALLLALAPPGTDFAEHAYQSAIFDHHGFRLWDNGWYAGRYAFVTYSLLYYPLASVFGMALVAIASQGVAVGVFSAIVRAAFGDEGRWAARTFALVWPPFVLTAAFPSALGFMFLLLVLRSLQRGRTRTACCLCALTLAASPLAFLFLVVLLAGIALARRTAGRAVVYPALTVLVLGALELMLWKIFPSGGHSPFALRAMLLAVAFCGIVVAVTWGVERARPLRWPFVAYGAATVAVYFVRSPIGEGITRLEFVALPVIVLALSLGGVRGRPRLLVIAGVGLAGWLNIAPLAASFVSGIDASASSPLYWRPAVEFLRAHSDPSYRVEAVDTVGHWPALELARAGIPLARGWFRQDDFPENQVLYGHLTRASYLGWLRRMGVRYVVLPDAGLDYTANAEAALLRSPEAKLPVVLRARHLTIFAVPHPRRIVTGPGSPRVLSLGQTSAVVELHRSGSYRVAIRYTPYWAASSGCIHPAPDGMTQVTVRSAGVVRLDFRWSVGRALHVLGGSRAPACSA